MFWLGFVSGAYALGFAGTLYALWTEPLPDRIVIAVFWPVAVIRNLLFD